MGQVFPGRRGYHINNAYGHDGLKRSKIQGSYNMFNILWNMTSFLLERSLRGHVNRSTRQPPQSFQRYVQTSLAYRYPHVASQLIPSHRPDGKSSATCSSSSFLSVSSWCHHGFDSCCLLLSTLYCSLFFGYSLSNSTSAHRGFCAKRLLTGLQTIGKMKLSIFDIKSF